VTVALAAEAVLFSFLVILAAVAARNVVSRLVAVDV